MVSLGLDKDTETLQRLPPTLQKAYRVLRLDPQTRETLIELLVLGEIPERLFIWCHNMSFDLWMEALGVRQAKLVFSYRICGIRPHPFSLLQETGFVFANLGALPCSCIVHTPSRSISKVDNAEIG